MPVVIVAKIRARDKCLLRVARCGAGSRDYSSAGLPNRVALVPSGAVHGGGCLGRRLAGSWF